MSTQPTVVLLTVAVYSLALKTNLQVEFQEKQQSFINFLTKQKFFKNFLFSGSFNEKNLIFLKSFRTAR